MQLLQEIRAPNFDLEKTLSSGQVFHWEKCGKGFVGAIADEALYVEQGGNFLKVRCGETRTKSPRRPLPGVVARYFALDHPLETICASFPRDEIMDRGARFLPWASHHSAAKMGMSCHFHLFVDEAGRPHSTNLARASDGNSESRANSSIFACTHFQPRNESRRHRKRSCANARLAIARKICSQQHVSSRRAR